MKITLVGPVYPYKGGISHYTGMLARTLQKDHDVTVVSYKMQYPKLLFKKEQKDFSNDSFKIEGANFWLNTANPFNIVATANRIRKTEPELVIIQWWHPYFAPCYTILKAFLKDIPVMYVCHNVFPHERFPADRRLASAVLKKGDMFIVQSREDEEDLLTIKEDALFKRTPHPTYNAFRLTGMSRAEARELLGIPADKRVILFFGFVREYKGLKHLINAMPRINSETGAGLLIVGDFGDDRGEYTALIEKNGVADCVTTVEGYIPDREVEKYFAACDIVALPYESATQSGIVQIAFGFEKPVIVTNVGGLPEVVTDKATGYVVAPRDPDALADAAAEFFSGDADRMETAINKEAYRFSWDRMSEAIGELCDEYGKM